MNSDGEQTEDSDNSYPCFEAIDYIDGVRVELKGVKVALAFSARMQPDMVCIDSGSNRLVLIEQLGITDYVLTPKRTLGTINSADALKVQGIGQFGIAELAMHVPTASANLIPIDLMSDAECVVSFGKQDDDYYCNIKCHLGMSNYRFCEVKTITATRFNDVWWITRAQMIDILFRGGYTVEEVTKMERTREDQLVVANLVAERRVNFANGSFHAKVGDRLEEKADYAECYKALAENAAQFRERVALAGLPVLAEHSSMPHVRHVFRGHPLESSLNQFEARERAGTLKRRADVEEPLMRASAANMGWRLDRGLAIDASAAISAATVLTIPIFFIRIFSLICLVHF